MLHQGDSIRCELFGNWLPFEAIDFALHTLLGRSVQILCPIHNTGHVPFG